MIVKIMFLFAVLSIIGNSYKGVHCIDSKFLNRYIQFNDFNLRSYNWICHVAFHDHMMYITSEKQSTNTAELLEYYTGLLRVHYDFYISDFRNIYFHVVRYFKSLTDWTNNKNSNDQMFNCSNNIKKIIQALNELEDIGILSNEDPKRKEMFNQCGKTFNLLITPTKKVSDRIKIIVHEALLLDNNTLLKTTDPITLKQGHILLLLKKEEEDVFINSPAEDKKSFIIRIITETTVNILEGMNHVLKDISKKDNLKDGMKLELLQSMYTTAIEAASVAYTLTDAKENFLKMYVTFKDYFDYKWKSIVWRTSHMDEEYPPELQVIKKEIPTMVIGEGRLTNNNGTGVNVRISMYEYYHFINIDINNEEQSIKDIIYNDEVHFLLELKMWLLTVKTFVKTVLRDLYAIGHKITPETKETIKTFTEHMEGSILHYGKVDDAVNNYTDNSDAEYMDTDECDSKNSNAEYMDEEGY